MDANGGILMVIGDLRMQIEVKTAQANNLLAVLEEARANIRSLMDDNARMQAKLTEMHDKYEVQRQ